MKKLVQAHIDEINTALAPTGAHIAASEMKAHPKLTIQLASGKQFKFAIVGTPSCARSRKNDISDIRRRVRELS